MKKTLESFGSGMNLRFRKIILVMKLTAVLIFFAVFHLSAKTFCQNGKFTIEFENTRISEVLESLEESSDYRFLFQNDKLDNRTVSVNLEGMTMDAVLRKVFEGTKNSFEVLDNNLVIIKSTIVQQKKVSGTVKSEDGEPIIGAAVQIKGTTTGVITDTDGNFQLEVNQGDVLVVSFVGMLSKEIMVNDQSDFNIVLEEDLIGVEEVVVVGYGTMKKKDITGAVSSIQADELVKTPVPDIGNALQGKVAGVDISQGSGSPGSGVKIRIRGNRSLTASNAPLIILDGIPFAGYMNDINTNDIESVEILKDASASAIYGSRGANGVILITTKRGKSNQTVVSVDSYYGVTDMVGEIDVRNAEEYVEQRRDVARFYNRYTTDEALFDDWELAGIQNGTDTDWLGYALRKGYKQSHQISVSGGGQKGQYLISGGFYDEQAIVYKGDYKRFSFRLNLDQQVVDWLKVGTSTNLTYSIRNNGEWEPIRAIQSNPLGTPYDENGELIYGYSPSRNNIANPTLRRFGDSRDEDRWMQINPNLYADINFTPEFSYRFNLATSFRFNRSGDFNSRIYNDGGSPSARYNADQTIDLLIENIFSYTKTIKKHNIQATGLYSIQENRYEDVSTNVVDLPYDTQLFYNIGSAGQINGVGSDLSEWSLMSGMARVHYGYDNKYMLTVTMRADGSSRLAEGNKWGFFPSAAASWRITEEAFMQDQSLFDDLKLRASFGRVGNTGISPYQTQGGLSQDSYNFGSSNAFGYYPSIIANPDLSWEMTNTINAGIDFIMFDGRLSGTLEGYQAYTSDLILSRQLPYTSGFNSVLENVGKTKNTGFEVTVMGEPIASKGQSSFGWSSDLTLAYNKEEIVELYNGDEDDVGSEWFIGEPVDVWFYYEPIGVWQQDEAAEAAKYNQVVGSVKIKDQNTDDKISSDDRVILGSPTPDWTIGWNNSFQYKNFDLSVYTYARLGQMVENDYYHTMFRNAFALDIHNGLDLDYWLPDNPVNTIPTASVYDLNDFPESLAFVDGSFLKVRDITLGYTFNSRQLQNWPVKKIRIYATAHNMLSFYKKLEAVTLDVETSSGYVGGEDVQNNAAIPLTQSLVFGVNINF